MHSSSYFLGDDRNGLYENGHWDWDEKTGGLVFITKPSLCKEDSWMSQPAAAIIGGVSFRDDMDLVEQQRFKYRYQRKTSDHDVVKLQDLKDLVLYTAPSSILSTMMVSMLHLPSTDRFLRALIFYIQYFLQISDIMTKRIQNLKVRTDASDEIERQFKENLEDLRILVGKEYSNVLTGSGEFRKYHHMGPEKKLRSLSKKNTIVFESLVRIAIQMVWLALGRRAFNQIELETHRLFKTPKFNMVEHQQKSNYLPEMSAQERYVLFGECAQNERMLKTHSPLMNEITCKRNMDCRLLGLGVVNYPNLNSRLEYLQNVLIAPENTLRKKRVSLGILGMWRSRFDTMLREIATDEPSATSIHSMKQSMASTRRCMMVARVSPRFSQAGEPRVSLTVSSTQFHEKLVPDIELPSREPDKEELPLEFPTEILPQNPCDKIQRRKWLARVARLTSIRIKKHKMKNKVKR